MLRFYEGKINGVSAVAAQLLLDSYQVDAIINADTAGGMDESIGLFDTVISTRAAYHDVNDDILTEFHPWLPDIFFDADPKLLDIAKTICSKNKNIYLGPTVTGEKFIVDDMRDSINAKLAPLSVDMETTAIAHVCYVNKIPFISIRDITYTAEHAGASEFEKNCARASVIAKDVVLEFLDIISRQE